MDSVNFESWISGYGYSSGYGYGYSSGYGSRYVYGDGYGYSSGSSSRYGDGSHYCSGSGSGYGSGYGSRYGDGDGSGYGYGYGSRDGSGSRDGDGDGNGSGSGYGCGDGDGLADGLGDGYGDGYGSGKAFTLHQYKSHKVYYVDQIPCLPRHIKNDIVFIDVIGKDMRTTPMVLVKGDGLFSHGATAKDAFRALEEKRLALMNFSEKKQKFLETFNSTEKYPAKESFIWHGLLTGSCEAGRLHFVKERGIDLEKDTMTVGEFFNTVKGKYGWERIKEISTLEE